MKNSKLKTQNSKFRTGGQSLFELVVAIAISALIIVTIVSLVSNSLRNATFSRNSNQAAAYAQQTAEWLRTQRDSDITTFLANVATPTYCFPALPTQSPWVITGACTADEIIAGTSFYREVRFNTTLVGGKTVVEADIVVYWTDAQGLHQVTSANNFTDWRQR